MLEQDNLRELTELILKLNPSVSTSYELINFVIWSIQSKKMITDALDLITQSPTDETEAKVLTGLKRSIDEYFRADNRQGGGL